MDMFVFELLKISQQNANMDMMDLLLIDWQQLKALRLAAQLTSHYEHHTGWVQQSIKHLTLRMGKAATAFNSIEDKLHAKFRHLLKQTTVKLSHLNKMIIQMEKGLSEEFIGSDDKISSEVSPRVNIVAKTNSHKGPPQPLLALPTQSPELCMWLEVLETEGRPRVRQEFADLFHRALPRQQCPSPAAPATTVIGTKKASISSANSTKRISTHLPLLRACTRASSPSLAANTFIQTADGPVTHIPKASIEGTTGTHTQMPAPGLRISAFHE